MQVTLDDGAVTTVDTYGERGPIVLGVHGITSSRKDWARLGERLASTHRVYAYDQRGHGDSAAVAGMTHERSVRDLLAVAAALPGPVDVLAGHSWGGAIVLLGGRRLLPGRVVAIDPMIRVQPGAFESEYVDDDLRALFALDDAPREAAIREMYANANPTDREGKVHAMHGMSVGSIEQLGRENRADEGAWDLREMVADYPLPLTIAVAGVDSVISADDLAFVSERGGPNVTVEVFADDGHTLHRSAFERFVRLIE